MAGEVASSGEDSPADGPSRRDQLHEGREGALLAASGFVVVVLFGFLHALEAQLKNFQVPNLAARDYDFDAVHGQDVACAFRSWARGAASLSEFRPIDPTDLVRVHVGADVLFVIAYVTFAVLVVKRWRLAGWVLPVVILGGAADLVEGMLELALAARPDDRYAGVFPWLTVAKFAAPLVLVAVIVCTRWRDLLRAVSFYRYSPATARLVAVAAGVFLGVASGGDMGAQAEDMLRREIELPLLLGAIRVGLALLLYLAVLAVVRKIEVPKGAAPDAGRLLLYGAVAAVGGFVVLGPLGRGSALVALGLLLGVVGLCSLGKKGWEGRALRAIVFGGVLVVLVALFVWLIRRGSWQIALGLVVLCLVVRLLHQYTHDDASDDEGRWLYVIAAVVPPLGLALLAGRLLAAEVASAGSWVFLLWVELLLLVVAIGVGWCFLAPLQASAADESDTNPAHDPGSDPVKVVEPPEPSAPSKLHDRWGRIGDIGALPFLLLVAVVVLTFAVAIIGSLWMRDLVHPLGSAVGAISALLLGITVLAAAGGLARLLAADWDRPLAFERLGFERTPVVSLLLVWMVIAVVVTARMESTVDSPHRSRTVDRVIAVDGESACASDELTALFGETADARSDVAQALCSWIGQHAPADEVDSGAGDVADAGREASDASQDPVPLVFVTASGGGVRAAVWTERVLDCLFLRAGQDETDPCGDGRVASELTDDGWSSFFAGGGASGGSVGLVSTVAQRIAPIEGDGDWVHELGSLDHVGPLLTQMILGELSLAPLGLAPGHDRAEVLIDGWSAPFGPVTATCPVDPGESVEDIGFLSLRAACPTEVPLLTLNGTVVATGRRFNISPIERANRSDGRIDLLDVLCADDGQREDVPLFDAAFLSARFPFVTPSGRFPSEGDAGCERRRASGVDVVDGGYNENEGTAQIVELLEPVQVMLEAYNEARDPGEAAAGYPEVRPVVVRIENGTNSGSLSGAGGNGLAALAEVPLSALETDEGNAASSFAEPARPVQAGGRVLQHGSEGKPALRRLESLVREHDVPYLHFALYPHPGTRFPLGWALTEEILDDVDRTFRLDPNQCMADWYADLARGRGWDEEARCRE